ncbi:uncharacterized protein BYT42DRAFT_548127 [Radiomyces spectabilis]|uniref:uncharacterized protein n=1 Tax=Radiomyces spectabilis TaxID=64574 RepID=UPI00221F24EC|nr:uncharacterized protein BYT42DRAFT_548127 [Radiomyces spectabilis]KAI8373144.1 hypothetical protein BYT42DRAFT_548127 [Radiomyces spectabilis]
MFYLSSSNSGLFVRHGLWILLCAVEAILAQQCLSLAQSKACPAFTDYHISINHPDFVMLPWLANISTVEAFDDAFYQYVHSLAFSRDFLGCNTTALYPRYAITVTCAAIVSDGPSSLPCNFERNILPRPLCQSTCDDFATAVEALAHTGPGCSHPFQPKNASRFANVLERCQVNALTSGAKDTDCILGSVNEPRNCGFGDSEQALCAYCDQRNDIACCQRLAGCAHGTKLATKNIVGIVVGVGGALAVAIAGGCWYRRKGIHHGSYEQAHTGHPSLFSQEEEEEIVNTEVENKGTNPVRRNTTVDTDGPAEPTMSWAAVALKEKKSIFADSVEPAHPHPEELANDESGVSKVHSYLEAFYRAVYAQEPQHADEITLAQNDIVQVHYYFDDGWALGDNIMTGERGLFPLLCVIRMDAQEVHQMLETADLQMLMGDEAEPLSERRPSGGPYPLSPSELQQLRRSATLHSNYRSHDAVRGNHDPLHLPSPRSLPQRSISMHTSFTPNESRLSFQRRYSFGEDSRQSISASSHFLANSTTYLHESAF